MIDHTALGMMLPLLFFVWLLVLYLFIEVSVKSRTIVSVQRTLILKKVPQGIQFGYVVQQRRY